MTSGGTSRIWTAGIMRNASTCKIAAANSTLSRESPGTPSGEHTYLSGTHQAMGRGEGIPGSLGRADTGGTRRAWTLPCIGASCASPARSRSQRLWSTRWGTWRNASRPASERSSWCPREGAPREATSSSRKGSAPSNEGVSISSRPGSCCPGDDRLNRVTEILARSTSGLKKDERREGIIPSLDWFTSHAIARFDADTRRF